MSRRKIGHNVNEVVKSEDLKALVERIEKIESDIADRQDDRKSIYAEAKARGFDTKAMRRVIREKRMDMEKLRDHEGMTALYRDALGILVDTPLGQSAVAKAGHA